MTRQYFDPVDGGQHRCLARAWTVEYIVWLTINDLDSYYTAYSLFTFISITPIVIATHTSKEQLPCHKQQKQ